MKYIKIIGLLICLAFFSFCIRITAQQNLDKKKPAEPKKETKIADGKADLIKSAWGVKKVVLMKGNVVFKHEDTVMKSDLIEYDESVKTAVSPGKLIITDTECDLTGDKGAAYFKKRIGVVEGNVVIVLKPKEEQTKVETKKENNEDVRGKYTKQTTITCNKAEYQYREKIASATGDVIFKQTNREAHADKAVYDTKKEILTLSGSVSAVDEKGQKFSSPGPVIISLKKGDEWIEAPNAGATFKIEIEE